MCKKTKFCGLKKGNKMYLEDLRCVVASDLTNGVNC
jgi:hypothetical protein